MGETMPASAPRGTPDRAPKGTPDSANVLLPPPLIFLAAVLVGLLLRHFMPLHWLPVAWATGIGVLLVALAVGLALAGILALRAARTAVDPHGSTTAIVQTGPYRFSRNPLYFALILLCVGIASWSNTLWILLALLPAVLVLRIGVIGREEAYLARKFGDEYRGYQARVRRWI